MSLMPFNRKECGYNDRKLDDYGVCEVCNHLESIVKIVEVLQSLDCNKNKEVQNYLNDILSIASDALRGLEENE